MSWESVLKSVAPTIATALGGPLAGMAVKKLTSSIFPGEDIPVHEMESRLQEAANNDPEIFLKIKEVEKELKIEFKRLDIKLEEIHAGDRASARDMAKSTSILPQVVQAGIYDLGFIFMVWAVFFSKMDLDGTQKDIALVLVGILSAGLVQINSFFYGSSTGSISKTAQLGGK